MYAIRSYYGQPRGAVFSLASGREESVRLEGRGQKRRQEGLPGLHRGSVITSYSIHYTKLYDTYSACEHNNIYSVHSRGVSADIFPDAITKHVERELCPTLRNCATTFVNVLSTEPSVMSGLDAELKSGRIVLSLGGRRYHINTGAADHIGSRIEEA